MKLLLFFFLVLLCMAGYSQDSSLIDLPAQYLPKVAEKVNALEGKLDKQSDKALAALQKQEEKIRRKLSRIDSSKAKEIFTSAKEKYAALQQKLENPGRFASYIPYLDTLKTSLKFFEQNAQLTGTVKEVQQKLKNTIGKVNGLENQLQKAEEIKKFLKERQQYLKQQLGKLGFVKEFKKLNKQAYYYTQQVNEYKEILKDPKKAERKAIELLSKTKVFQDFMKKNSMLASLFRLPGTDDDALTQANLAGLQTRRQVNQLIQQQIGAGGPNARAVVQQNMQQAQAQLNELKNKITQLGGGGSDLDMPDFKPNNQKTKSFLKRLEYGANVQSQKASAFFPVTTDVGLTLGYKLNDKSVIGIGASYKVGWGRGWQNISITHQGIGARSFIDWKIPSPFGGGGGGLYISGGYEQNYRSEIKHAEQLKDYSAWQSSGLIGLSKVLSLKTKLIKKTKVQLLWDFLSYQQVPRTQAILFRIGYTIKYKI